MVAGNTKLSVQAVERVEDSEAAGNCFQNLVEEGAQGTKAW